MELTKINTVGRWYFHQYELDGEFYTQECTKEEYDALALPGASAPNLPKGAKWINSQGNAAKFDTPSGFIENGQYAEVNGLNIVKIAGVQAVPIEQKDITQDGILDSAVEAQIIGLRKEITTPEWQ